MYNKIKHMDFILIIFTVLACTAGIVLVFSLVDTNSYQKISYGISASLWITKIAAVILGLSAMFVLSAIKIEKITKHWKLIGAAGVLFTLLTFTPIGTGPSSADDRAWISLFRLYCSACRGPEALLYYNLFGSHNTGKRAFQQAADSSGASRSRRRSFADRIFTGRSGVQA